MSSNLDYLASNLMPLEEKVKAYLETEKELRNAKTAARNESVPGSEQAQVLAQVEQRPPTGRSDQNEDERTQSIANLRADLARQQADIIGLLPTRNEWVKVNLGYGPSRVGAWQVPASATTPEQFELRIVH